jgi:hypothetical protein
MTPDRPAADPEGDPGDVNRKSQAQDETPHVSRKDVLAMILAGFQVILPPFLILAAVVVCIMFLLLAVLR